MSRNTDSLATTPAPARLLRLLHLLPCMAVVLGCWADSMQAQAAQESKEAQDTQESLDSLESVQQRLQGAVGSVSDDQLSIRHLDNTPLTGIYQLLLNNGEIVYADASGEYLILGEVYQFTADGLVDLGVIKRRQLRAAAIAALPAEEMIVFSPPAAGNDNGSDIKHSITVFTDVDCGYCRQLHGDMEQILERGIEVRYLAYPRNGETSESFEKMISVWCSEDRQKSLTQAKRGQNLPQHDCEAPVAAHYALGNELGVQGTPAIITRDGRLIPGYAGLDYLLAALDFSRE